MRSSLKGRNTAKAMWVRRLFGSWGGTDIERRSDWEVGVDLRRLYIFLLHPEMAFAGCKGLGEVLFDEVRCEAGPRVEMAAVNCPKEGRGYRDVCTTVEVCRKILFRLAMLDGAVC